MRLLLERQLTFLEWIADHRSAFFNKILLFFNFFDTPVFFLLLIPFVWIGISWKWGSRLFYLVIFSAMINHALKIFFGIPRPCTWIPELALVDCTGYAFPSGGAQSAALLTGFVWIAYPKTWAKNSMIFFAFCVGCSRFLLGVHYPTDVLGGYIVGIFLTFLFAYTHRKLALTVVKTPYLSLGICVACCLFFSLFTTHTTIVFLGGIAGGSVGIFLSGIFALYLPSPKTISAAVFRGTFTLLSTWLLWKAFPPLETTTHSLLLFIEGFTIALWVPLIANLLVKMLLKIPLAFVKK